jgi:hypothetical protein
MVIHAGSPTGLRFEGDRVLDKDGKEVATRPLKEELTTYRDPAIVRVEECARCQRRLARQEKAIVMFKRFAMTAPWALLGWMWFVFIIGPAPTTGAVLIATIATMMSFFSAIYTFMPLED